MQRNLGDYDLLGIQQIGCVIKEIYFGLGGYFFFGKWSLGRPKNGWVTNSDPIRRWSKVPVALNRHEGISRSVVQQLPYFNLILLLIIDMIMFRVQRAADSGRDKPNSEQKQMLTNSRLACRSLISKSILQILRASAA